MTEIDTEVLGRLVTGRKKDGRAMYDPQAKAALVQACLKPGVSVARMAMQYGINANLLRCWITQSTDTQKKKGHLSRPSPTPGTGIGDFVPLRLAQPSTATADTTALCARLLARLPNGVEIDLSQASQAMVLIVLQHLAHMPCSDSTTR